MTAPTPRHYGHVEGLAHRPPCEAVIARFVFGAQTCDEPAVIEVRCPDEECGNGPHTHWACGVHAWRGSADRCGTCGNRVLVPWMHNAVHDAERYAVSDAKSVECSHLAPCTPTYLCAMHRPSAKSDHSAAAGDDR